MRNANTEASINGIYSVLTRELDFLVNSNMGENQRYFERFRADIIKLQQLTFMYIAEIDSTQKVTKLPDVPRGGGGYGVN